MATETMVLDSATVQLLADGDAELERLCQQIDRWFFRREVRQRLRRYLRGLLAPVKRRNGWQLAEQTGEPVPNGIQRFVREAQWGADEVRDDLRDYVIEHLGTPSGLLIVDETGFLKKGTHSVGVQRQYSGTAGRTENCQIGVFLAYTSEKGTALIDRELYLPREWAHDVSRRQTAGIPETVAFATKPELARQMIERAWEAGVPCAWVTGDEVYGNSPAFRTALEQRGQPYVLAVASTVTVGFSRGQELEGGAVGEIARGLPDDAWVRLSVGEGAKGPRFYDWAWVPSPTPETERTGGWRSRLLVRRSVHEPVEYAFYFTFARAGVGLEEVARVAGSRWQIEAAFEGAKQEVGLDEYEVRKWASWYRYMTLAMLAYAFLSVVRSRLAEATPPGVAEPPLPAEVPSSAPRGGRLSKESIDLACEAGRGAAPVDRPGDPASARGSALADHSNSGSLPGLVLLPTTPSGPGQTVALPPAATPTLTYLAL